jgi:hypothetical protein
MLAALAPARTIAWDCATGSGQAARGLVDHFDHVIATDASARQIEHAERHPRIEYRVAPAEASGLDDHSVELVTVAQAAHWFDMDRFSDEVRRVATPNAVVALWTYTMLRVDPGIDRAISTLYSDVCGAYWPANRRLVEDEYRTITFPFSEIPFDTSTLVMERWVTLDDLLGYVRTWSAWQQYVRARGNEPLDMLRSTLVDGWASGPERRRAWWPLFARVGRVA